jgi:peptidoglycan hydrolase CwlO-like protein
MKQYLTSIILFTLVPIVILLLSAPSVGAASLATSTPAVTTSSLQEQIDANNQQIATLNQQIATYQAALQQVGSDKKTLQAAINSLNLQKKKIQSQIAVTERQIQITQLQIQQSGNNISATQQTIAVDQSGVGEELRVLEKADHQSLLVQMLGSNDLVQAWTNVNAALQIQDALSNKMQALVAQENSLNDLRTNLKQKQSTLGSQQQALVAQQQSLATTEQSKTQLLKETNAKESVYEQLLAAAQAELASFSAFAQNAGGSKLIGNQTVCDSWGCYYNQRDSAWGNDPLNGTKYDLASDGCLVTSMAMVMTHYGYRDVTPVTINSNPGNFASYYPAYLLITINVDGVSATRTQAAINATLATGNPVIVGLHAYGGSHFVVLTSRAPNGGYIMRDPYIENGNNIPFSSHYSLREITSVAKVVIGA